MKSTQLLDNVVNSTNELAVYAMDLERKNAMLKQLVRVFAKNLVVGEDGQVELSFTAAEVEQIKFCVEQSEVLIDG